MPHKVRELRAGRGVWVRREIGNGRPLDQSVWVVECFVPSLNAVDVVGDTGIDCPKRREVAARIAGYYLSVECDRPVLANSGAFGYSWTQDFGSGPTGDMNTLGSWSGGRAWARATEAPVTANSHVRDLGTNFDII